eukprot:3270926-Rhodomonas_salina.1
MRGQWLGANGWKKVQARLFDAGHTRYEAYASIEPEMLCLDEKSGMYWWSGRTVQLVGEDRYFWTPFCSIPACDSTAASFPIARWRVLRVGGVMCGRRLGFACCCLPAAH